MQNFLMILVKDKFAKISLYDKLFWSLEKDQTLYFWNFIPVVVQKHLCKMLKLP